MRLNQFDQIFCSNSHDPRKGLWPVKIEKFGLEKRPPVMVLENPPV